MGIIRAITSAASGTLADQWAEVIEPEMSPGVIATGGIAVRKNDRRNQNRKGTDNLITDGSIVHVPENMFMLLVDGGKVIDYSAEAGYYEVRNDKAPSLFNGQFRETLADAFARVKFGGVTPFKQDVRFINLSEIKDISFGTPHPLNYFDNFYNAELHLRAHGFYSIRVVNPLKFYVEVARDQRILTVDNLRQVYQAEFLSALQSTIGKMSVDGMRISHVSSRSAELSKYMADVLDESWENLRGMHIESVGIASISYDEQSRKLIDMRNKGAMLSDPTIREGYTQGAIARGIEAAGSNSGGSMAGFMGIGMGMQAGGGFTAAASMANQAQAQAQTQQAAEQVPQQQAAPPADGWPCSCGHAASGNFCSGCGSKKPERPAGGFCSECGAQLAPEAKFCSGCGTKL